MILKATFQLDGTEVYGKGRTLAAALADLENEIGAHSTGFLEDVTTAEEMSAILAVISDEPMKSVYERRETSDPDNNYDLVRIA